MLPSRWVRCCCRLAGGADAANTQGALLLHLTGGAAAAISHGCAAAANGYVVQAQMMLPKIFSIFLLCCWALEPLPLREGTGEVAQCGA